MRFEYDKKHPFSWGRYRCETCSSIFDDIHHPNHDSTCSNSENGSNNLVYIFGPREAKKVIG